MNLKCSVSKKPLRNSEQSVKRIPFRMTVCGHLWAVWKKATNNQKLKSLPLNLSVFECHVSISPSFIFASGKESYYTGSYVTKKWRLIHSTQMLRKTKFTCHFWDFALWICKPTDADTNMCLISLFYKFIPRITGRLGIFNSNQWHDSVIHLFFPIHILVQYPLGHGQFRWNFKTCIERGLVLTF